MKRYILLLMVFVVLALSACEGAHVENSANSSLSDTPESSDILPVISMQPIEEPVPIKPDYFFENKLEEKSFALEDGEVVGSYSYSFPLMYVGNMDDLAESDRDIAQRNVNAFNTEMMRACSDAVSSGETLCAELLQLFEEEKQDWVGCDEKESLVSRAGEILSVHTKCYYYGGGAHPYCYSVSYIFDLSLGQFIDPAQIGDDPEAFRTGVAALLIEQAEALGEDCVEGFWSDYRDIISNWNDTAVWFDENGMTVLFSAYELGPYAMGAVELFLDYESLAEVLGPGGLAYLGATE